MIFLLVVDVGDCFFAWIVILLNLESSHLPQSCTLCTVCWQDGYLDASEVAHWILPGEVDHADNEAKHLIHETDTDKVALPPSTSTFILKFT